MGNFPVKDASGTVVYLKARGSGTDPDPYQTEMGYVTTPTHSVVSVATSTTQVLAANANRVHALFVNDSDTVIYVMLGAAAVLNQGIRLNPGGGAYELSLKMGNLYTGLVNAIHGGTGTKALLVLEGV